MRRPTEQLSPAQLARKSVHRLPSQQGLLSAPSGLDNISRMAELLACQFPKTKNILILENRHGVIALRGDFPLRSMFNTSV